MRGSSQDDWGVLGVWLRRTARASPRCLLALNPRVALSIAALMGSQRPSPITHHVVVTVLTSQSIPCPTKWDSAFVQLDVLHSGVLTGVIHRGRPVRAQRRYRAVGHGETASRPLPRASSWPKIRQLSIVVVVSESSRTKEGFYGFSHPARIAHRKESPRYVIASEAWQSL